jgi:hypothetical protein
MNDQNGQKQESIKHTQTSKIKTNYRYRQQKSLLFWKENRKKGIVFQRQILL